jgi:hypothetical protein
VEGLGSGHHELVGVEVCAVIGRLGHS